MQGLAQVKSAKAKFVERKVMRILNAPLELHGTLVYRAPAFLEKQTLKPRPETLTLDHDTIVIDDPVRKRQRTLTVKDNPVVWALVESMRATLAGDLPALNRFYRTTLQGTEQQWILTLDPRDGSVKRYLEQIRIGGTRTSLRTIEIFEAEGDRSTMLISDDRS